MVTTLILPARLDLTVARPLARDISELSGNVAIDASGVTHLGGLCLQILLAARQYCEASGRSFKIADRSDDFDAALALFGVDPRHLCIPEVAA
ncbi:MAG: lipid asymmetry maintenance protein MlaB [Paracoccus sp. (in: a-proteobacteria)]